MPQTIPTSRRFFFVSTAVSHCCCRAPLGLLSPLATRRPPDDLAFTQAQDASAGAAFLRGWEHMNVTVPYKQNRVVG